MLTFLYLLPFASACPDPRLEANRKFQDSSTSSEIPACGYDLCDIPSRVQEYVNEIESQEALPLVIRANIYVVANDDGSNPLIAPSTVLQQYDFISEVFSLKSKISFQTSVSLLNSTFLRERYLLPFCSFILIGNGDCDLNCNTSITSYDGGDCLSPENIPDPGTCALNRTDQSCNMDCNIEQYLYDYGRCCALTEPVSSCHDPRSDRHAYIYEADVRSRGPSPAPLDAWNTYVAQYANCTWCGAISTMPFYYNPGNLDAQGSIFNYHLVSAAGLVPVHEAGHTFGLWHVWRGSFTEGGSDCNDPCFEGVQYPLGQVGSATVGDLCPDTRPSQVTFVCADPAGSDCAGNAWADTPVHNAMGFSYLDPSTTCITPDSAFSTWQAARMRCYAREVYESWIVPPAPSAPSTSSPSKSSTSTSSRPLSHLTLLDWLLIVLGAAGSIAVPVAIYLRAKNKRSKVMMEVLLDEEHPIII